MGGVCAALSGHTEQAQKAMGRVLKIKPTLRIAGIGTLQPMRAEDFVRWTDGLRKAGMPE